jgi:hypothetical protein
LGRWHSLAHPIPEVALQYPTILGGLHLIVRPGGQ